MFIKAITVITVILCFLAIPFYPWMAHSGLPISYACVLRPPPSMDGTASPLRSARLKILYPIHRWNRPVDIGLNRRARCRGYTPAHRWNALQRRIRAYPADYTPAHGWNRTTYREAAAEIMRKRLGYSTVERMWKRAAQPARPRIWKRVAQPATSARGNASRNPPDPARGNASGIQRLNAWRNWNIIQYATPATGQMIHVISQCIVTKLESR